MFRKGIIKSIDLQQQVGIIIDEHDQEIEFFLIELLTILKIQEQVYFKIELTALGLMATDIRKH